VRIALAAPARMAAFDCSIALEVEAVSLSMNRLCGSLKPTKLEGSALSSAVSACEFVG
jgi:hypothetical protein